MRATTKKASIYLSICIIQCLGQGCAGPATPFGSHLSVLPKFEAKLPTSSSGIALSSFPENQLYHSPFDLTLQIEDKRPIQKGFRYEILYNGKRIDRWYKGEKIVFDHKDPKRARIVFENLSLIPGRENEITFLYYSRPDGRPTAYNFRPPSCPIESPFKLATLSPFDSRKVSISAIEQIAKERSINPTLLAALVAQESGFNPNAISWAKAVGLTQVTSLANQEIMMQRPDWQYDPKVEKQSFLQLKTNILTGKINAKNDWRLDRLKSLEGGAIYLNLLQDYWRKEEAQGALTVFKGKAPLTDILLASYNSGAYRVKKSILRQKQDWLKARELKEARKYVMNIKSFCYSFSEDGPTDQNSRNIASAN